MTGFVPFIDTAKVCIDFTLAGRPASICLHFHKSSATDQDYEDLATDVANSIDATFVADFTNDLSFNEVTVYDQTSETSPKYVSTSGLPQVGGAAADTIPSQNAWVCTYETNRRGRSFRGRSYMPGLTDAQVVDSLILGATLTNFLSKWETVLINIEVASGWTFVVASRQENGVPRTLGVTTPVEVLVARNIVRNQRRRTKTA